MKAFKINDWTVTPDTNTVSDGRRHVHLEPRIMDLLIYFAENPGEVLSREEILTNVWQHTFVSDSALQAAVSTLRKAFNDNPRQPRVLETIPKRGYRLVARNTATASILAVLPFVGQTMEDEETYLADGLTDGLIDALGQHRVLKVISRHSIMSIRHEELSYLEIANKLNVDYVVEGRMTATEKDTLISVRLFDTADNTYVWTTSRKLDLKRVFEIQSSIALAIAEQVAREPVDSETASTSDEVDPQTVDDYLRGRFHWYKFEPEHFARALDYFQAAAARSPDFAPAYAGIADVWGAYGYWGILPGSTARKGVRQALDKGRACDPRCVEVIAIEGAYQFHCQFDWSLARAYFEESIGINPSFAQAHMLLALLLGTIGDPAAISVIRRAKRLDPLNAPVAFAEAMCLSGQNRYDAVAQSIERIFDLHPMFPPALELKADLCWLRDDPGALEVEARIWQDDAEVLSALRSEQGGTTAAARCLQNRESYVSPRMIARLLSLGGSIEEAIDVLESAIADEDLMQIDFVAMNPSFLAVRRHPGFQQIAANLMLAQADC